MCFRESRNSLTLGTVRQRVAGRGPRLGASTVSFQWRCRCIIPLPTPRTVCKSTSLARRSCIIEHLSPQALKTRGGPPTVWAHRDCLGERSGGGRRSRGGALAVERAVLSLGSHEPCHCDRRARERRSRAPHTRDARVIFAESGPQREAVGLMRPSSLARCALVYVRGTLRCEPWRPCSQRH